MKDTSEKASCSLVLCVNETLLKKRLKSLAFLHSADSILVINALGFLLLTQPSRGWEWMAGDGSGWQWMGVDGSGWQWMAGDGSNVRRSWSNKDIDIVL